MLKHVEKKITSYSAKIMYEGQLERKRLISNRQLEKFLNQIKKIPDKEKRYEAQVVWFYLQYGRKIGLEGKKNIRKVNLYMKKEVLDIEPDIIITCNPELFVILDQIVQN